MSARHPGTPEDDATSAASVAAVYLEQAASMQRLGSEEGAQWHYRMAEHMARRATQLQPHNADLYLFLARVCREAGFLEKVEAVCAEMLASPQFERDEELRTRIAGEQLQVRRLRALKEQSLGKTKEDDSLIYVCLGCGHFIRYLSLHCPFCRWAPSTPIEMAKATLLSTAYFPVHKLLVATDGMRHGASASTMVPNLEATAREYLSSRPEFRHNVEAVLRLLQEKALDDHFEFPGLAACAACGNTKGLWSLTKDCSACKTPLRWPPPLRLLVCIQNILWLIESGVYPAETPAFAAFVKLLVAMASNLVRLQESPSDAERGSALRLLGEMRSILEEHRMGCVVTTDPHNLKILAYETTDKRATGWLAYLEGELGFLVSAMSTKRGLV